MTQQMWSERWQYFNVLYEPHDQDLQELIWQYTEKFELAYDNLEGIEEQESFIGECYVLAQKHKLPLSLVDWWRTLQVYWIEGQVTNNFCTYPDSLPRQGNRYMKYQWSALRAFRIALSKGDDLEVIFEIMFLAAMLEAIRQAEAQRILLNKWE